MGTRATGTIYLATDQSIPNNQFFGLGTASSSFVRNTVVIPQSSTIIGLVFSIRTEELAEGETITAEIFRSTDCGVTPTATGIQATVTGPNPPNCCAFSSAGLSVDRCDLLSVKVTRSSGGALPGGAAATILLSIP